MLRHEFENYAKPAMRLRRIASHLRVRTDTAWLVIKLIFVD